MVSHLKGYRNVKILVVDDEDNLRDTVTYNLEREGYTVAGAADGESALSEMESGEFHAVILDVMLPGMDGFEVCRLIRKKSVVPIIMLTARDSEVDRVVGLEIGADDYLPKPFAMRELLARVKALLRRDRIIRDQLESANQDEQRMRVGDLIVDLRRRTVTIGERAVQLTPKEYDLLTYMMRNRGQICSADRLVQEVWGYSRVSDTGTVPVHIRSLRRKIEANSENPLFIETVRGAGYRFAE